MKKKFLLGLAAILLSWTAWAVGESVLADNPLTITWNEGMTDEIDYDGDETNSVIGFTVTFTMGGATVTLEEWEDGKEGQYYGYTATYYKGAEKKEDEKITLDEIRDAGEYTLVVEGKGLANGQEATKTFTVKPVQLTYTRLTLVKASKTYGQDDQVVLAGLVKKENNSKLAAQLKTNNLATAESDPEFENFLKCLEVKRYGTDQAGENADTYRVFVSAKSAEAAKEAGSNYVFANPANGETTDNAQMTIEPLALTVTVEKKTYAGIDYNEDEDLSTLTVKINNGETLPFDDNIEGTVTFTGVIRDAKNYELDVELTPLAKTKKGDEEEQMTLLNNYTWNEKAQFTIDPAELTIKEETGQIWSDTYGSVSTGADITSKFNISGWEGTDKTNKSLIANLKLKWYEGATAPTAANSYPVKVYWTETVDKKQVDTDVTEQKAIPNYTLKYEYDKGKEGWFFAIAGKAINSEGITIAMADADLKYKAENFTKDNVAITVKDGENKELEKGTDYEIVSVTKVGATTEGETVKNAGEKFVVTIKGEGNYKTDDQTTLASHEEGEGFLITKRQLAITPKKDQTVGKVYGEADPSSKELMAMYDITGWPKDAEGKELESVETIGLTMERAKDGTTYENVGDYVVRLHAEQEDGSLKQLRSSDGTYKSYFTNYEIDYDVEGKKVDTKFHITPRTLYYSIAANVTKVYNGKTDLPEEITFVEANTEGIEDAEQPNGLANNDVFANLFTTEPTISVKPATTEGEEDETAPVTVKDAGTYTLVAEGAKAANYNPIFVETADNYTITKRKVALQIQKPAQTVDFGKIVDGVLDENLQNTWRGSYTYILVNKADGSTLTANDVTGHNEDAQTIRSMVTFVLSDEAKSGESGTYEGGLTAKVDGPVEGWNDAQKLVWNNYSITEGKADLTIKGLPGIVLNPSDDAEKSVAEVLEGSYGAKVNTVTINNLINYVGIDDPTMVDLPETLYAPTTEFEAEKWYTLVLPFDVTVRELSAQLGYAIVNVPDVEKTKATGDAYFKLTMGEVKANTLMAFKVDADQEFTGLTFGTEKDPKLIVKQSETEPINGVSFVGVYEKTSLESGNNDYYLWPYKGKFYDVDWVLDQSADGGQREEFYIYPLNGYVHFATSSANARIFMEEADGTITAINAVTGKAISNKAEGWYTIGGVKLNGEPTEKGIYINNGKKVVIK